MADPSLISPEIHLIPSGLREVFWRRYSRKRDTYHVMSSGLKLVGTTQFPQGNQNQQHIALQCHKHHHLTGVESLIVDDEFKLSGLQVRARFPYRWRRTRSKKAGGRLCQSRCMSSKTRSQLSSSVSRHDMILSSSNELPVLPYAHLRPVCQISESRQQIEPDLER